MSAAAAPALAQPSFQQVKAEWRPSDVVVLDRNGQPLQRLRVDKQGRRLDWVGLADTSPAFRHALVVSEDRRFYQHSGVDWSGVAAAAWGNLWNTRTRGASTLTMQLAGLLDNDLKVGRNGRSLWQKMGQGWSAAWLETHWSKAQILEAYLNLVGFRGELVGLSALSATLFGKLPAGLNLEESAIAVALIRAPNAAPDKVAARACRILQDMRRQPNCAALAVRTRQALAQSRAANPLAEQDAPHFAQKLLQRQPLTASGRIASTLDLSLQRYAASVLRRHLAALAQRNVQDGALVVLDNASGDILAWVGSSGRGLSNAAEVDGVTSLRQAGSTLKPFTLSAGVGAALPERRLPARRQPAKPANRRRLVRAAKLRQGLQGLVSARTALASSLNVPAVRAIEMVGPNALRDRLFQLGLKQPAAGWRLLRLQPGAGRRRHPPAGAGQRLPNPGQPGAGQPDPLDAGGPQAQAAAAAGRRQQLHHRRHPVRPHRARAHLRPGERAIHRYWSAVKTGTSKDMRDNWAVGFSRQRTVAVWVSNAAGEPMWDVSGMHGAAPVWQAVLDRAQQGAPASCRRPAARRGEPERAL